MSVKVMGQVWDTALPPNQKLVLLAYADAAEHDGTEIWPGHEAVEAMTSYSVPTVARITRELLELGVLVRVMRGRKGVRAKYLIDLTHPAFGYQDDIQSGSVSISSDEFSISNDPAQHIAGDTPPVLSSRPSIPVLGPKAERTALKDAIAEWWIPDPSLLLPSEWGRVERAAKELHTIGATPQDVIERGSRYWPDMTRSPQGLVQNWAVLAGDTHRHKYVANGPWGLMCECGHRQDDAS